MTDGNGSPGLATTGPRPLDGILVLDFTRVLAGPFCTALLADLGARVIKVERAGAGDPARGFGPFKDERSLYFAFVNRGKESIALDLKRSEEDRALALRIAERADVLVENFRPGAMDRLGLGWEALSAQGTPFDGAIGKEPVRLRVEAWLTEVPRDLASKVRVQLVGRAAEKPVRWDAQGAVEGVWPSG